METGFRDIADQVSKQSTPEANGQSQFGEFETMQIGRGDTALHADADGIWLGAMKFRDAPFSVDMHGNVVLKSIASIPAIDQLNDSVSNVLDVANSATTKAENAQDTADTNTASVAAIILEQDQINLRIAKTGGSNLLRNSSGLKGNVVDWQTSPVVARNDATIVSTDGYTESGKGFKLVNQFIEQTNKTIPGTSYSFYCRFKKNCTTTLTISGYGTVNITAANYVDETYAIFKFEFTATDVYTQIHIANTDSLKYTIISDMVLKPGIVSGWQQAPNEMYGVNFTFDENGFSVTDSKTAFKSVLDSEKLAVYDISNNGQVETMAVGSNYARIRNLIAFGEFMIRQQSTSSHALRFIPRATGVMLVVNT